MHAQRLAAWLAGIWAGILVALGFIAAPGLFGVLERTQAGLAAARLFETEAYVSLGAAVLLILLERRRIRAVTGDPRDSDFEPLAGGVSQVSPELMLLLGALFCTVLGHFGLQPMMSAARDGQGVWSFATLHGASTVLFLAKLLLVLGYAWRAGGRVR